MNYPLKGKKIKNKAKLTLQTLDEILKEYQL